MLPPSLAGKTAVITGAAGGIGSAIATRFAQEGASVILAGRTMSKLQGVLQEIQKIEPCPALDKPQTHVAHHLDVQQSQQWTGLVEKHQVDILVNCAGISQRALLLRAGEAEVENMLSSNLRSVIFGCRAVGKQMIAQRRGGCIITVSSLLAHRAVIGTSIYAASKAGQLGLTTALSREFGAYGIRVNAIVPGYIATDMTEDIADKREIMERIPLKRFGATEEVADAAAFLAKNSYANNCIVNLDGGLSAV
ncbi:hypothetical protein VTK56DRAFT_8335 [Thermocarpiscus australiensis]